MNKENITIESSGTDLSITFHRDIDFQTASIYQSMLKIPETRGLVVFDLSEICGVHSSFIGFMIDLKRMLTNAGGELQVILSEPLDTFFSKVGLDKYFTVKHFKKSA